MAGPHAAKIVPGTNAKAVNISDTVALTDGVCRSLYIATNGTIKIKTSAGDTVGPITVFAGMYLYIECSQVFDTDTTVTEAWAIY